MRTALVLERAGADLRSDDMGPAWHSTCAARPVEQRRCGDVVALRDVVRYDVKRRWPLAASEARNSDGGRDAIFESDERAVSLRGVDEKIEGALHATGHVATRPASFTRADNHELEGGRCPRQRRAHAVFPSGPSCASRPPAPRLLRKGPGFSDVGRDTTRRRACRAGEPFLVGLERFSYFFYFFRRGREPRYSPRGQEPSATPRDRASAFALCRCSRGFRERLDSGSAEGTCEASVA